MSERSDPARFFRYLVPGIVFFIEGLIFLLLLHGEFAWARLKIILLTKGQNEVLGVGGFLSLLVGSGGVGYLLAMVYRVVVEGRADYYRDFILWAASPICSRNDYDNKINQPRPLLRIRRYLPTGDIVEVNPAALRREESWRIFTFLIHERLAVSARTKTILDRSAGLTHYTHAAGTSLVGAVLALVLALLTSLGHWPDCPHFVLAVVVGGVVIWLHWAAFRSVLDFNLAFHKQVLARELDEAFHYFGQNPTTVLIP